MQSWWYTSNEKKAFRRKKSFEQRFQFVNCGVHLSVIGPNITHNGPTVYLRVGSFYVYYDGLFVTVEQQHTFHLLS